MFRSIEEIPAEIDIRARISEVYWQGETKYITNEYTRSENDNWICATTSVHTEGEATGDDYTWRERTEYVYNDKEQCVKETCKKYNSPDNYDTYQSVVTEYTYDTAGYNDILKIKRFGSDEYSVNYQYDNTYHLPVKKTFKQDADTTIIENYTLTDDKKSVSQIQITYDWFSNILTETDTNGNVFAYTYDKLNRPILLTNPDNGTISVSYGVGALNNYVQVTNENGNTMKYTYMSMGNIQEEKDVTANKVLKSYNYTYNDETWHSKTTVTNYSDYGNTTTTTIIADAFERPVKVETTDSSGNVIYSEEYVYEQAVNSLYDCVTKTVNGETDDKDYTTKQYTDQFGNLVKEEVISGSQTLTTEYSYDYVGNLLPVKSPRAVSEGWTDNVYTTQYEYDIDGQVTKTTDIYGNFITNEYDGLGRLVRSADAEATASSSPSYSTYVYDVLGRLLEAQTPIDNTSYTQSKYYYDNNGNVTKAMVKNGTQDSDYSVTETSYNWRNNPVKVLTDGTDSAYYYDNVGNVLRMYTGELADFVISGPDNVSGADYKVTSYTYDTQNRVLTATDALGKTESNVYDITGSPVRTTDRNGNIINLVYDGLGNLTEQYTGTDSAKENLYTYTYNRMSLPLSVTSGGVTTTYTYNNLGQILKEELTTGIVKEYNYYSNGNRTQFKLTKDNAVQMDTTYTYDKLDRLQTVTNGSNTSSYTYDRNGRLLTDVTDGYTTTYTYNAGGWITGLATQKDGATIQNHSYEYYPDGNISQKQSTVGAQTQQYSYQYDKAGRLTQEQLGSTTTSYTYDAFGNRATMVSGDVSTSYTYDGNNRLLKEIKSKSGIDYQRNYTYDDNGNNISWYTSTISPQGGTEEYVITTETDGTQYGIYGYDAYNRVTSYTNGVTSASYTYDANNLRQSKTVDGVTTNHIWDGADIVMDVTGETSNTYYRGAIGIAYANLNGTLSYYHTDAHGDITALTDASGAITQNYQFDAFGNQQTENEDDLNPFRYCGEYFDEETGLIYLRNRYYDTAMGRFINEDPVKDGLNWYVYANNNPVMFVDPWGLYYIIGNTTYCSCMDPRCRNFAKPTGTYTVYADTWATAVARNLIGLAPGGSVINWMLEKSVGVVGGNSATDFSDTIKSTSLEALGEYGSELFSNIAKKASTVSTIYSGIESGDTVYLDKIAFNLLKRNNISMTSTSKEKLDIILKKAYGFILDNDMYFSKKYDGAGTLFEIDNKISGSKTPSQTIAQLVNRYESNLFNAYNSGAMITRTQISEYVSSYRKLLENYQSRIDIVNSEFSRSVQ